MRRRHDLPACPRHVGRVMPRLLWAAEYHLSCCYPAVPVMIELRRRGHEVVVLSVPDAEALFTNLGFEFRPNRRFPVYDFADPVATPYMPDEQFRSERFWRWWRASIDDQAADVDCLLEAERFSLVVSKSCMFLSGAGLAAERRSVPWVSYIHFCLGATERAGRLNGTARSRWDALRGRHGLPSDPREDSELYWAGVSPILTLLLGIPRLQYGGIRPEYVKAVGPIAWDPPSQMDAPPWLESLGRRRPAALVSTSHLWRRDDTLVLRAVEALASEDFDVVVTVPAGHHLPELPPNVVKTAYFPHHLLIPRVSVVVCSAGFGTATRAVLAGRPTVVVPLGGDGEPVAEAVEHTGVGVVIRPDQLNTASVRAAVSRALSDPAIIRNVQSVREEGLSFPDPVRSAADHVEAALGRASEGGAWRPGVCL